METKSYEYNGKRYDFILSMKAKTEIEKAQKAHQSTLLQNPAVKSVLKNKGILDVVDGENKDFASLVDSLESDQIAELVSLMDGQDELDPVEIGFIVLSTYPTYREEVTRPFFDGLVDDMDVNHGVEETFNFFTEVKEQVFTKLAAMQKNQTAKTEAQSNLQIVASKQ